MWRPDPGEARGGEGLVLDKSERPGTGLKLDVGQGKPLATLALQTRGLWEHAVATPARGGRREIRGCPGPGTKSRSRVGDPKAGVPQTTPCVSVFVFGGDL